MERRDFLKASAMSAASAAVLARTVSADAPDALDPAIREQVGSGVTWDKAPCRFCGTGCHVQVGVRNDRVVAIAGDRQAAVNRGLLCVKGYHVGLALYGGDRLTRPMLKRGDVHVPISWDEALGIIADRIQGNPAGFAFYGSGQ